MPTASPQPFVTHWRRWIALAALFGIAMVCLPLLDAWRRQGLELRTAADARRALAASAQVVLMQRALAAHRPFAAAVLSGRAEQEAERLRRQQVVDSEAGALAGLLEQHGLHRALDEADQLRLDWSSLLEGIGRRKMTPAASDRAHDLLGEQTFVIMDLIGSAGRISGHIGRALQGEEWLLAVQALPRLAGALATAEDDDPAGLAAGEATASVQAQARRAARAAAEVLRAADARAAAPDAPAPDPAFVRALVAVQQHAAALANPQGAPADGRRAAVQRARSAATEAHAALFTRLDADLAFFAADVQAQRHQTAAAGLAALLLGLLAAWLALPAASRAAEHGASALEADVQAQAPDAAPASTRPESHGPAADLLERLRRLDPGSAAGTSPAAGADPPARRPG